MAIYGFSNGFYRCNSLVGVPTFRGLRTVSRQGRSYRRQFWDKFLINFGNRNLQNGVFS
ncbi:hypothetical protein LEP1GSC016_0574 [Leptospira borgpetersenii serovar Hardjo-bovis str. Sponselee]|uniref:Uncharacterized protein n=1 Tax=Leptospira borgpetersenii serovar Hardjo-bovis str. Sponselee TaxID=1303729 RepID=M6C080_LEPBO|nr:hypothetical protein LEP1GSC016_0574 [Leptospira borgpetersenii serovar Hardjo-bovis str. Sponselee]